MASPKSKISRSKRGSRRAHTALKAPTTHSCSNCGSLVRPHTICYSCGYYKDREVLVARD